MEIETTKPTPEQQELQSLFQQTDAESIVLLVKENEELLAKVKAWEELADTLFVYADEVKCGTHNQALWEAACQDIEKYKKLKEFTDGTV